jgi:N6-L-threonylcarbamoyladenine synthase
MTRVLAIETSCDETAAAVVEDGFNILSNIVASQIDIHRRYGGVFPEIASRQHILAIGTVVQDALVEARLTWDDIDAIAVTHGPGLAGSLLVGVNMAKGVAMARGLPLIGVNHLEGHLYSNWLDHEKLGHPPRKRFPALCLLVSGGHTELVLIRNHGNYEVLGRTIDDAAGEAFDKVARLLGLGYPGGPAIERAAASGNPKTFYFPRAKLGDSLNFSFSGLKTAVLREVQKYSNVDKMQQPGQQAHKNMPVADLAASFQMAVVDILVSKTRAAVQKHEIAEVLLAGGVSANALLRNKMMSEVGLPVRVPPLWLCTDNAAMIGAAGYWRYQAGETSNLELDVVANLRLDKHTT